MAAYDRLRPAFHAKVSPSDIVQRTMHDAVVGMPDFRGGTQQEFIAWLLQILHHRVIDVLRTYSGPEQDIRREVSLGGDSSLGPRNGQMFVDKCRRPDEQIEEADKRSRVWALAARLAPRDQAVLEFRYKLDATIPEIAEILGIAECAARKRVQRAVRRLARLLDEHRHEP